MYTIVHMRALRAELLHAAAASPTTSRGSPLGSELCWASSSCGYPFRGLP